MHERNYKRSCMVAGAIFGAFAFTTMGILLIHYGTIEIREKSAQFDREFGSAPEVLKDVQTTTDSTTIRLVLITVYQVDNFTNWKLSNKEEYIARTIIKTCPILDKTCTSTMLNIQLLPLVYYRKKTHKFPFFQNRQKAQGRVASRLGLARPLSF